MKIVFISTDTSILSSQNGDVYTRHQEYARHFEQLVVIVFSLEKNKLKSKTWKNLRLIPTNSNSRWEYISDTLKIIDSMEKPDLISTQDPFVTALAGVVSKIRWQVKLNVQIHNDYFTTKYFRYESLQNYVFYWLGKFNLHFADSIRVVGKRLKVWRNAFVAPVAVDLNYFWHKPHKARYGQIVTVARLVKQKNIPLLLEVARSLVVTHPKLRFVIVGEGPERKNIEQKIVAYGLERNIFLVGQKTRSEIREIFTKSDLYLQTSSYEGWGLAIIEAMSSGLPVVMTDTGCAGEVVQNAKVGGLVTPLDGVASLTSAIKLLLRKRTHSVDLVNQGQELLRQRYNKVRLIKQLVNNLKEMKVHG